MAERAIRREKDRYFTPQAHARAMVESLAALEILKPYVDVVEPSCGDGIFLQEVRLLRMEPMRLFAVDIESTPTLIETAKATGTTVFKGDWLADAAELLAMTTGRTLVLGNPPYSDNQAHVEKTLEHLRPGDALAFLLPLPFLATQERCRTLWSKRGLRYLAPFAQRPSFTGGGSAAVDYGMYVWEKDFTENAELLPPIWTKESK